MIRRLNSTAWQILSPALIVLSPSAVALGAAALMTFLVVTRPVDLPKSPAFKVDAPAQVAAIMSPTYRIKSRLRSASLNHGDWRWDESQAPPTGPTFIAIDTASQTLSVFRGGYAIGVAVIVFGDDRKPTPLGDFRVKMKDADHWSRTYDAPMPHTLRLTDDGISIHGSEEISADLASHGCVGLPRVFARKLFGAVAVGDPVRITNGVVLKEGDTVALPDQPLSDASPRNTRAI